jgi:nitroreductase
MEEFESHDEARCPESRPVGGRPRAWARYRKHIDIPASPWSEALDVILSHRTVRRYSSRALPADILKTILAAAQSAPTSSNLQAWSVVAVTDPARKHRFAELAYPNTHVGEAPLLLMWLADLARLRTVTRRNARPSAGLDYLETFMVAVIDAALAAQNVVVMLDSFGIGSCFCGSMRNHPELVAKELGLPEEVICVFGMAVGHPAEETLTDIKPRLPQELVLHHERYDADPREDAIADYNRSLRSFQAEQGMNLVDWTEMVARRIGTVEALQQRHLLKQSLAKLGFKNR